MPSLRAGHRLEGDGGDLVVDVGFAERNAVDACGPGFRHCGVQRRFVGDGANDDERVRLDARERPSGRESGVCGLDGALNRGKVGADKDVDREVVLAGHGGLFLAWG